MSNQRLLTTILCTFIIVLVTTRNSRLQPVLDILLCLARQGGFAAIDEALSTVDRKDVKGIGVSGQQHGFVPLDGDGQVDHSHSMDTISALNSKRGSSIPQLQRCFGMLEGPKARILHPMLCAGHQERQALV